MAAEAIMVRKSTYPMLSVDEALTKVISNSWRTPTISLGLHECISHVTAEAVKSNRPHPTFPASIMDGYAVMGPFSPGVYDIQERIHAGSKFDEELQPGKVVYITTGAKVPMGANAVIKVEDTEYVSESQVRILTGIDTGGNVRQIGSDITIGDIIVNSGVKIRPADVGLMATVGCNSVLCHKKPIVGVMSTGDELVDALGTDPVGSQVRDCNRPVLLSSFKCDGYECIDLGIISDVKASLKDALLKAVISCDIIVTSGGVSMGDADHLKSILEEIGSIHFGRINMKPGKPTTFATIPRANCSCPTLVFALPGNPVSCIVTKTLFVDPALKALKGLSPEMAMASQLPVQITEDIKLDPERAEYHRANIFLNVDVDGDGMSKFKANSTGNQRSSRLLSMQGCNALLCLPKSDGIMPKGSIVDALVLGEDYFPSPPSHLGVFKNAGSRPQLDLAVSKSASGDCGTSSAIHVGDTRFMRVAILTVSDRASQGIYEDKSGPEVARLISELDFEPHERKTKLKGLTTKNLKAVVHRTAVVPDEIISIRATITSWLLDNEPPALILTTGGTGFGLRDTTPEAVRPLLIREAPGIAQALLNEGLQHTPLAVLSRPVVGVNGKTLIVTLPGSVKAIQENIVALGPILPRIMELLIGENPPDC